MEGWQRLDLECISDTALGEGKKVRYGFFGKRKPKLPVDYNAIRLDKKDVDVACSKHTSTVKALLSEAMGIPEEFFEVHSYKLLQSGTLVPLKHELHCDMCEATECRYEHDHTEKS